MRAVLFHALDWLEYGMDRLCAATHRLLGYCYVMNWWVNTGAGRWLSDEQRRREA